MILMRNNIPRAPHDDCIKAVAAAAPAADADDVLVERWDVKLPAAAAERQERSEPNSEIYRIE